MSKDKQEAITEEQFKKLCRVALPHLNDLIDELKKLGICEMTNFFIQDDGYFSFSIYNSEWSMSRLDECHDAHIRRDYAEPVEIDPIS